LTEATEKIKNWILDLDFEKKFYYFLIMLLSLFTYIVVKPIKTIKAIWFIISSEKFNDDYLKHAILMYRD
jgi:hypothetical protein